MKIVKIAKTVEEAVEQGLRELQASRSEVEIRVLEEPRAGFLGLLGGRDAVVEIQKLVEEEDHLDILSKIDHRLEEHEQVDQAREDQAASQPAPSPEPDPLAAEELAEKEPVEEPPAQAPAQGEPAPAEASEPDQEPVDLAEIRQVTNNFLAQMLYEMNLPAAIDFEEKKDLLVFTIHPEDKRNAGIIIGKRGETLDALQYLVNLVANRHSDRYIRIILDINNYRNRREEALKSLARKMAQRSKKYGKPMRLEPMNPFERRIIHSSLQQEEKIHTYSEGKDPHRRVVIEYKEED